MSKDGKDKKAKKGKKEKNQTAAETITSTETDVQVRGSIL
jgi:hypothetical protein